MRTFITTIAQKVTNRPVVASLVALIAVILVPAAVFAWGPERPTFTIQQPAQYVTFNSITNNPAHGDERNFMKIREKDARNETYTDNMSLTAGKEYVVYVYYHNNAASNYNASGVGVAQDAFARAEVPAVVPKGQAKQAAAYVGASNANPVNVYDDVTLNNTTNADIALRYVPGSTNIHNFGPTNNAVMPDTILSGSGVKLGYDALDGTLPGCNEYAGYITFVVKADQPNFTFKKDVRVSGTSEWKDSVSAKPGTKVDYLLSYENTGTTQQNDVVLKDELPAGIKYISGSARLTDAASPNGKVVGDGIGTTGINIGSYTAGSNAFLVFSATVNGTSCETLTNRAAVETNNGSATDTANVVIPGDNCVEALPTTGPVEVIIGLVGVAAITVGIVYYVKSRKDLDVALHEAQSNHSTSKSNLISAPEPAKAEEVDADKTNITEHVTHKTHKK